MSERLVNLTEPEPEDVNTLHICDINHFIAFLEAVRDEGVRRYPDEWAMPEGK